MQYMVCDYMAVSGIAAQETGRQRKIDELVDRFQDMAASHNSEQRNALHLYFLSLDIDHSVPDYPITNGIRPVGEEDLAHVRQALERAGASTLDMLYAATSTPRPIERRSEGNALEASPV